MSGSTSIQVTPYTPPPNPLTTLNSIQTYKNAVATNAQIQAGTANTQASTAQTNSNVAAQQMNDEAKEALAAVYQTDDPVQAVQSIRDGISRRVATGQMDPAKAAALNAAIPQGASIDAIRKLAAQHAYGALSASEAVNGAMPKPQLVDQGGYNQYQTPPTQLNPNAPPIMGGPIQKTVTPFTTPATDPANRPTILPVPGQMPGGQGQGSSAPPPDGSPAMVGALRGQEATPNGQTSVSGARGQMQVTPGFFQQYALPGESFASKRDVEAVAQRGIGALERQYPNDPGRVATAYFSGQSNVAPPGGPNPYIADKTDPNGARTSSYVAGAVARYNAAKGATTTATGTTPPPAAPLPAGTMTPSGIVTGPPAGTVQVSAADKEANFNSYQAATQRYNNSDAVLIANYREAYALGKALGTGAGTELGSDIRARVINIANAFGVPIAGEMSTNAQARSELDKVLNQILVQNPAAGRSDQSLATTAGSSPNLGMNTQAMLNQIRILYGQTKQNDAAMLEHDPTTQGQSSSGQPGFQERDRGMKLNTAREGFAADLMTKEEIQQRIAALGGATSTAGKAFLRGIAKNSQIYKNDPTTGLAQ